LDKTAGAGRWEAESGPVALRTASRAAADAARAPRRAPAVWARMVW